MSSKPWAHETISIPHSNNPHKGIPVLGLGTWQAAPGEVEAATYEALKAGYIHIDAAAIYRNEPEVGNGIKKWGGNRDSIWVTSKLWNNAHQPAQVPIALEKTLKDLQLDYLDLYLIHWPAPMQPGGELIPRTSTGVPRPDRKTTLAETWAAMEALLETGKVKNIGISNFNKKETEEILRVAKHKPDVIQMELHPYLQLTPFVKWLQGQGITVTAYSPFGNLNPLYKNSIAEEGRIVDHPTVKSIAEKTNHTTSQVLLSWGIAKDFSVIPKSANPKRIAENFGVFKMTPEDVAAIDKLDLGKRYNDGSEDFGWSIFSDEKSEEQVTKESLPEQD